MPRHCQLDPSPRSAHARARPGLRLDAGPGIRRKRAGTGFTIAPRTGKLIADDGWYEAEFQALAMPPASQKDGSGRSSSIIAAYVVGWSLTVRVSLIGHGELQG